MKTNTAAAKRSSVNAPAKIGRPLPILLTLGSRPRLAPDDFMEAEPGLVVSRRFMENLMDRRDDAKVWITLARFRRRGSNVVRLPINYASMTMLAPHVKLTVERIAFSVTQLAHRDEIEQFKPYRFRLPDEYVLPYRPGKRWPEREE